MTEIKWTKATRQALHGFRVDHKTNPADQAPDLELAWRYLRTLSKPAVVNAPAPVQRMLEGTAEEKPPTDLDPVEEIARVDLFFYPTKLDKWGEWATARHLVALWCEVKGVRFVVDLLSMSPPYDIGTYANNGVVVSSEFYPPEEQTRVPFGPWTLDNQWEPLFWALRCRLGQMNDEDFGAAVDSCREHLDGPPEGPCGEGGWRRRAMLVFAFSRDRELAGEQIDAFLEGWDGSGLSGCLVAAAPDIRRAEAAGKFAFGGRYSMDIVESFGVEAKPILDDCFERAKQVSQLKYLKPERAALKLIDKHI